MATFTDYEIEHHWHIWQMYRDGAVALVHRETLLDQIIAELEDAEYVTHTCDAGSGDQFAFEKSLRSMLGFPAGQSDQTSLDSFNDHLSDLQFSKCTGIVVIVTRIQRLHERNSMYLHNIMDIFAVQSRYHLCFGHRLMLVLQSDDRDIQLRPVGGRLPVWNSREPRYKHESDTDDNA